MKKIILENFRCFREYQEIELKPLTLLVGENSSGKSTFLAAISLAARIVAQGLNPDFNEEPFQLGAYDQIAHFRGGRGGAVKSFTIGFESGVVTSGAGMKAAVTFKKFDRQPIAASWKLLMDRYTMTFALPEDQNSITLSVEDAQGRLLLSRTVKKKDVWDLWCGPVPTFPFWFATDLLIHPLMEEPDIHRLVETGLSSDELTKLSRIVHRTSSHASPLRVRSVAPIRSKPQRTYNPTRDTSEPTGGHVPMVLSRVWANDRERWMDLAERLKEFGRGSGLFGSIEIKALGRGGSDPFQIVVKFDEGTPRNVVDVGYGVSQALPILVDAILEEPRTTFLMQQPEVHLHPRAQAQVGTFLGQMAKALGQRFVVETHSDYLIDRVCMDVRDRVALRPEDVTILYFEKAGVETKIFPLSIDKNGNITDSPPGYRDFFLQEEKRFLGVAECV